MWGFTSSDIKSFWKKISLPDLIGVDQCWEWQGASKGGGYGNVRKKGKNFGAHRIAFELAFGHIDPDLFVCHSCDNPKCCNPAHLWQGTNNDNLRDMRSKGRQRYCTGESNPFAKLTKADVNAIRQLATQRTYTHRLLASMFGVSHTTIGRIVRRTKWKDK